MNVRGHMSIRTLSLLVSFACGIAMELPLYGEAPVAPTAASTPLIPPSVSRISPAGMQRGSTSSFTLEGRNISNAGAVIFDDSGMSGTVTEITDVPEQIVPPRAGEDLTTWQYTFWDQADTFLRTVRYADAIRKRLSLKYSSPKTPVQLAQSQ